MGNRPAAYENRPTITPELVERFAAYRHREPMWGSLHVVLEDDNLESVDFCITWAESHGDSEGANLARILARMSKSQRGRIGRRATAAAYQASAP